MDSLTLTISSSILGALCIIGFVANKFMDDEEARYGLNAVMIAFIIGYVLNMLVVYFCNN